MPKDSDSAGPSGIALEARTLMRRGLKASLATLDAKTGSPYASLITVATAADGTPVFLISTLARHTQNLINDPRASILFDGTGGLGDPLQGGRLSVSGTARKTEGGDERQRFLTRHPEAEVYADFGDFAFYRLEVETAHYVGGFGSIHDLEPAQVLIGTDAAASLLAAETEIIAHMNEDHADAIRLYATRLLDAEDGDWRMTGCDPEGCDLVLGETALRLVFPERVTTPDGARKQLVALVKKARG